MKISFRFISFVAATTLFALSGCATTTGVSTEQKVQQRAQERWDLVLAGDFAEAYEYYSPGYRSTMSLTDFIVEMKLRRVKWTKAEFQEMSCTENVCDIDWRIYYEIVQPVPGLKKWNHFTAMSDDWILLNGQWWYVPPKPTG